MAHCRPHCRPLSDADLVRARKEHLPELEDRIVGCVALSASVATGLSVLMISQRTHQQGSYWTFPKGSPDDGESDLDAAARETTEETGVRVSRIEADVFEDVGYSFIKRLHTDRWQKHPDYPEESKRPVMVTHKIVRYYLGTCDAEAAALLRAETEEAAAVIASVPSMRAFCRILWQI